MIYLGDFFQQFNKSGIPLDQQDFDKFSGFADTIAVAFYDNNYELQTRQVQHLLNHCQNLIVYNNEAVDHQQTSYVDFLQANDRPNITFFADAILNFDLVNAKFFPLLCWFIDHVNYYSTATWAKNILGQLVYDFDKPQRFDCLLGAIRTHRDIVSSLYSKSSCQNQIIFSYFREDISTGIWTSEFNPGTLKLNITSDRFEIGTEEARLSAIIPVEIYNNSYYSVVAETLSNNLYSHFTEKVAKPIVGRRPFVVFAGQNYLKNLRKLGFKTFDKIIDESYDDISDDRQRFASAWQQVESLCHRDPKEVITRVVDILDYNQQHFLTTDWVAPAKNLSN